MMKLIIVLLLCALLVGDISAKFKRVDIGRCDNCRVRAAVKKRSVPEIEDAIADVRGQKRSNVDDFLSDTQENLVEEDDKIRSLSDDWQAFD